jgi:hypothetical protein
VASCRKTKSSFSVATLSLFMAAAEEFRCEMADCRLESARCSLLHAG